MRPLTKSPNLSVSSVTSVGSSTSSLSPRLSPRRGGLLQSPPPSPGLPSLIPRHGKKPTKSPKQQMKRLLLATCGLAALIYLGLSTLSGSTLEYTTSRQQQYELIEGDTLPEEPSALVVLDEKMRTKWTVSIPSNLNFPLQQSQYKDICSQAEDISNELQLMNSKKQKQKERRYYDNDPYFVEVDRAQRKGILPKDDEPWQDSRYDGLPSCAKSLTFVMETADAGMGNTLLSMWLAYGLAKKEGRAFFIDDTRWYVPIFIITFALKTNVSQGLRKLHHILQAASTTDMRTGTSNAAHPVPTPSKAPHRHRLHFPLRLRPKIPSRLPRPL